MTGLHRTLWVAICLVVAGCNAQDYVLAQNPPGHSYTVGMGSGPVKTAFSLADIKHFYPAGAVREFNLSGPDGNSMPPWGVESTGDLASLKQLGKLRILALRQFEVSDAHNESSFQRKMVLNFAKQAGLKPAWVYVDDQKDLVPYLLEGKGDIVIGDGAFASESNPKVAKTLPMAVVRYEIISRKGAPAIKRPGDLSGHRIAIKQSAPIWHRIKTLKSRYPDIEVESIPDYLSPQTIIDRVANGTYDLAAVDFGSFKPYLTARDDVKAAFDLSSDKQLAWLVRPGNPALREALNRFLLTHHMVWRAPDYYREDLPGLEKRKVLRVITRVEPNSYFLRDGQPAGFEYELAQRFARRHHLSLELVVADSDAQMLEWLKQGRGDLVAAPLTAEDAGPGVSLSREYNDYAPEVITRANDDSVKTLDDLQGHTVVLRTHDPLWSTMKRLQKSGIDFKLQAAPEGTSVKTILDRVANGQDDLTVVNAQRLDIALGPRNDLKAAVPVQQETDYHWAVRADDKKLLAAVDGYLKGIYRGEFYNVVYRKYFGSPGPGETAKAQVADAHNESISPYDGLARKYAERYGFDWRLIVALIYQESKFNPDAHSSAGAIGLMQLLPKTAAALGFSNIRKPEEAIHAGVQYLDHLRERFGNNLAVNDRTWFAIAAYNAGFARVQQARRLAKRMGLDPDRWFGNVERAMLAMARGDHGASNVRCACGQTFFYVRRIRARYDAYLQLMQPGVQVADYDRHGRNAG